MRLKMVAYLLKKLVLLLKWPSLLRITPHNTLSVNPPVMSPRCNLFQAKLEGRPRQGFEPFRPAFPERDRSCQCRAGNHCTKAVPLPFSCEQGPIL